MKELFTKKILFTFGCITYIFAYLIYLYKAENTVFWNAFYYIKDYGFILFLLIILNDHFFKTNRLIAFLIVIVFQYFNFNVVLLTKTLTDFEKYCNSQVFTLMFANTTLSILLFMFLTANKKNHNDVKEPINDDISTENEILS
jgi:hypothetical protein